MPQRVLRELVPQRVDPLVCVPLLFQGILGHIEGVGGFLGLLAGGVTLPRYVRLSMLQLSLRLLRAVSQGRLF